jgi:hypothetical protein
MGPTDAMLPLPEEEGIDAKDVCHPWNKFAASRGEGYSGSHQMPYKNR